MKEEFTEEDIEDRGLIRKLLKEGAEIGGDDFATAMIIHRTLHVKYCFDCMRYNHCKYQNPREDYKWLTQ